MSRQVKMLLRLLGYAHEVQCYAPAEPKNKHHPDCNVWKNDLPCNCGAG